MAAFLLPLALAPIIGGAMSLAGGALSVTGGVINAGATAAGIAADMAGGVIGAVGGLMGGGKSGNVQSKAGDSYAANSPQGRMIVQAKKKQKQKESAKKGGMSLAKMKPSISGLIGGSSGSMMMPSMGDGEKTPTGLLSQILGQITTNTGLLSSMLQVLASSIAPPPPPPTDVISDAKEPKGDNEGPGRVKQVFSALGSKMKGIAGSLGGTAKFLMKGLLGVGALIAFTKYRDNITGFISRTFEMLEGFGSRFADGEDPLGGFLDSLLSTGEGSIIASLKTGLAFIIEELIYALKLMINDLGIPGIGFDDVGRSGVDVTSPMSADTQITTVATDNKIDLSKAILKNMGEDSAYIKGGGLEFESPSYNILTDSVVKKVNQMYETFQTSGGRVQWTGIGNKGFQLDEGPDSIANAGATIEGILNTRPILDGKEITFAELNSMDIRNSSFGLDGANTSAENMKQVIENLRQNSDYRQNILTGKLKSIIPFTDTYEEKIQSNILQNRLLQSSSGASLTPSMPVMVADSSQHQTITGDTFAMQTSPDPNDKTFNALMDLA